MNNLSTLRKKVQKKANGGLAGLVDTLMKKYNGSRVENALLEHIKFMLQNKNDSYLTIYLNKLISSHESIIIGTNGYQGSIWEEMVNDKIFTTAEFYHEDLEKICESLGVCEERIKTCSSIYIDDDFDDDADELIFESLNKGSNIVYSMCDLLCLYQRSILKEDMINLLTNSLENDNIQDTCKVLKNRNEIENCISSYEADLRLSVKANLFRITQKEPASLKKFCNNLTDASSAVAGCYSKFNLSSYRSEITYLIFDLAKKTNDKILTQTCDVLVYYNNDYNMTQDIIDFVKTFYRLERSYSFKAREQIRNVAEKIIIKHGKDEGPKKLDVFFKYLNMINSSGYDESTIQKCMQLEGNL